MVETAEQRRKQILTFLARSGYESIHGLSRAMRVSPMTIRRDLNHLESVGLLRRTHGGAITEAVNQVDLDYKARSDQQARAKRQIGEAAADFVEDGDVVFLDAGTTVLAMTEFLLDKRNLTVVTHSLPVVDRLNGRPGIELYLLGGQVRRDLMSVVGFRAEEFLAGFQFDKAFLGTGGIDMRRGLTHSTPEEIPLKKLAARNARQCFVLADRAKIGKGGLMFFLTPAQIDCLIMDGRRRAEVIHWAKRNAKL